MHNDNKDKIKDLKICMINNISKGILRIYIFLVKNNNHKPKILKKTKKKLCHRNKRKCKSKSKTLLMLIEK